jgi:hypothetical protein
MLRSLLVISVSWEGWADVVTRVGAVTSTSANRTGSD